MEINDVVFDHIYCFHYYIQMGSYTGNTFYVEALYSTKMEWTRDEVRERLGSIRRN